MNRETDLFNPTRLEMSRSTFDEHPTVSGTMLAGRLIPIKTIDILPGDSVKMDVRSLIKMVTPVYPTMDELFMDVAFYFVPNSLVLGRRYGNPSLNDSNQSWNAFVGAQDNLINMPVPEEGTMIPAIAYGAEECPIIGSLADYFGYPIYLGGSGTVSLEIDCLDHLAYFAVWNENYRDPNTMEPITWSFSSGNGILHDDVVGSRLCLDVNNSPDVYSPKSEHSSFDSDSRDYIWISALDGPGNGDFSAEYFLPLPVCRFHGYFGSALPWPQRNQEGVLLPLGDTAPVYAGAEDNPAPSAGYKAMRLGDIDSVTHLIFGGDQNMYTDNGTLLTDGQSSQPSPSSQPYELTPANLFADLSLATAASINALRASVQQQRWYEHLARSGNRIDELTFGLFGVRPHDSGDDRPLYLGGKRIPLNITMVASTNGGTDASGAEGAGSLGSLGGFSHTNDQDHFFYHSFDKWGKLICVACIRCHDTFGNMLRKSLNRLERFDYYWPTFAHLGEQAIKANSELNYIAETPEQVLGYQEAWSEYRHDFDQVTGLLRPGESLDFMTYANDFGSTVPTLAQFLNASTQVVNVDKTLSVSSVVSGWQFIYQFTFDYSIRRCMPTFSDPGLIDHF